MKRQVLIFDLDGTLIDSRRDLATGVNLMRGRYGLRPLPLETVTGFIGDGVRTLVERALRDAPRPIDLDEAVRLDIAFYREHLHDETVLYPGVREGLTRLAGAGHALALLTNKPEAASRALLCQFGIEPLFRRVVGGDSGLPLKPRPDAVHAIRREAGGAPEDTWMIGDHHTDLAVARRAGVHSLFAAYGFGSPGAEQPERTAACFDEVAGLFDVRGPGAGP